MTLTAHRIRANGMVRILFGLIWLIDAQFKWRPAFIDGLATYLSGALPGQPAPVQAWIHFWMQVVKIDPTLFAYFVATAETALALALIFGVLSNLAYLGGSVLALLFLSRAGLGVGYDRKLAGMLGSWAFLASGPVATDDD